MVTGSPDAAPTPPRSRRDDAPPKVGDRVRVTVEGVVDGEKHPSQLLGARGNWFYLTPDGRTDTLYIEHGDGEPVSVEVLTPPAPTYEAGDVILAADGSIYTRRNLGHDIETFPWLDGGWLLDGHTAADWIKDDQIPRPVTLLVRGGKPVQP